MEILITLLIAVGALNMVRNIVRYHRFLISSQDVLSSGKKSDRAWMLLAQVLLIFFLIGYVFAGIFSDPDLMVALILFFGSIFVTIVETLMFKLIETAKERSIDVAEVLVGVIDARDPLSERAQPPCAGTDHAVLSASSQTHPEGLEPRQPGICRPAA